MSLKKHRELKNNLIPGMNKWLRETLLLIYWFLVLESGIKKREKEIWKNSTVYVRIVVFLDAQELLQREIFLLN
jgi:hypothetical protein